MRFGDLNVGEVVNLMGTRSVILAIEKPHPLNHSFWMFVWYIIDEDRLSFDMLHPDYELIAGTTVGWDHYISFKAAIDKLATRRLPH